MGGMLRRTANGWSVVDGNNRMVCEGDALDVAGVIHQLTGHVLDVHRFMVREVALLRRENERARRLLEGVTAQL
jgi:hypothetical protein